MTDWIWLIAATVTALFNWWVFRQMTPHVVLMPDGTFMVRKSEIVMWVYLGIRQDGTFAWWLLRHGKRFGTLDYAKHMRDKAIAFDSRRHLAGKRVK